MGLRRVLVAVSATLAVAAVAVVAVSGLRLVVPAAGPGEIKADEVVRLFPTLARWTDDGGLVVPIHGWIYEPEKDSVIRRFALEATEEFFEGRETAPKAIEKASEDRLHERLALFLVDSERDKQVRVRVAHRVVRGEPSDANGHFFGETTFAATSPLARSLAATAPCTFPVRVITSSDDERVFEGYFVVPSRDGGVAVVCDLDDTLKVSNVRSEKALFTSTFWDEWVAVDGMPALLRSIAKATGATTHYLTASRWPLQGEFAEFLQAHGCPYGSFHMREFDFSLRDFRTARDGAEEHKRAVLREIAGALPKHEFVLIGDSTEADAVVYGEFARAHPDRVRAVLIRLVGEDRADDPRFAEAFRGVDPGRVVLFSAAPDFEEVRAVVTTPVGD